MDISTYKTSPVGSILLLEETERSAALDTYMTLPQSVKKMVASSNTGAFIRGLVKAHKLAPETAPSIALFVLQVAIGERSLAQLAATFSSELQIPNDKAQQISNEIEKELIAPISIDLNDYLSTKKKNQKSIKNAVSNNNAPNPSPGNAPPTDQPQNMLDLKNIKRPPAPPPVPLR